MKLNDKKIYKCGFCEKSLDPEVKRSVTLPTGHLLKTCPACFRLMAYASFMFNHAVTMTDEQLHEYFPEIIDLTESEG